MKKFLIVSLGGVSLLIAAASCIRRDAGSVRLTFKFGPKSITSAALTCIAVNVVGEGIPSRDPLTPDKNLAGAVGGDHCTYPGVTTKLVARDKAGVFELQVPPGKRRLIQVFGVESTVGCADANLGDLMAKSRSSAGATGYGGFYEIGRSVSDLVKSDTVSIANTFDANSPKDYTACKQQSGPAINFGSTKTLTHIGGKIAISTSGGTGSKTYSIVSGGGSISGSVFTAGASAGTTVIRAQDTIGVTQNLQVTTFNGNEVNSNLDTWFIADSLSSKPDGYTLVSGDKLINRGGSSSVADLPFVQDYVKYYVIDGPNNTPVVTMADGYMEQTGFDLAASTAHLFLVAKATQTTVHFFCLTSGSDCTSTSNQFFSLASVANILESRMRVGLSYEVLSSTISDPQAFRIMEVKWTSTANYDFAVGSSYDNLNPNLPTPVSFTGGQFHLGHESGGGFYGSIAEILFFKTSLSTSERNATLNYLRDKYNLTRPT